MLDQPGRVPAAGQTAPSEIWDVSVPGPGLWTIDAALSRGFRVRENLNVELRGEAFNLTNSYRAGPVTTGRNNTAQFGQILTAQDPRIMQVALKVVL